MEIKIENFECWAWCKFQKQAYPSRCPIVSYTFTPGIYALTGQIDNGGWAFTYALSSSCKNDFVLFSKAQYYVDNTPVTLEMLRNITCTLGESKHRYYSKLAFLNEPCGKYLKKALKRNDSGWTYEELVERLELSEGRLRAPFEHTSREGWRISAAIGLAENKKIFCYPWFTNNGFKGMENAVQTTGKLITEKGGVLLIPIENEKLVEGFVNDVLDLTHPQIYGGETIR